MEELIDVMALTRQHQEVTSDDLRAYREQERLRIAKEAYDASQARVAEALAQMDTGQIENTVSAPKGEING